MCGSGGWWFPETWEPCPLTPDEYVEFQCLAERKMKRLGKSNSAARGSRKQRGTSRLRRRRRKSEYQTRAALEEDWANCLNITGGRFASGARDVCAVAP